MVENKCAVSASFTLCNTIEDYMSHEIPFLISQINTPEQAVITNSQPFFMKEISVLQTAHFSVKIFKSFRKALTSFRTSFKRSSSIIFPLSTPAPYCYDVFDYSTDNIAPSVICPSIIRPCVIVPRIHYGLGLHVLPTTPAPITSTSFIYLTLIFTI